MAEEKKGLNEESDEKIEHVHGPGCSHDHDHEHLMPFVRSTTKIGRNDPCHCGSLKKYKKCCGQ